MTDATPPETTPDSPLFPPAALAALHTPGVALRWAAVQAHLHPRLVLLAAQVQAAAVAQFPLAWSLYETSYKAQRAINRGRGQRAPIDDYHVAFDRAPRGAGLLVSVSGAERAVLVGLQLWGVRKADLREVWYASPALWQPLVARIAHAGSARFQGASAASADQPWIERYLGARNASYLWAGFAYPWDSLPDDLAARLVADVLALFPLNEALMEQAEERAPQGAALLREQRASYAAQVPTPPIETLGERVRARGFAISETLLRAYHVALQTRPLVILPGISGTGKTRLTRLYADALHNVPAGADNPYYLLVAVQPDWHSARDMLGYYNAITGRYHPTPFLHLLLRAAADPHAPYFVCLDEMNLARPEYYLAPLLSALETVDHLIDLGTPAAEVQTVTGETLRNPLRLPLNMHLIGTVNVDESTHTLSDKLLDRANVIELTDVDLDAFRATYPGPVDEALWQMIVQAHALLTQAGQPFGYRTLAEMLDYITQAAGVLTPTQALDLQIKQKLLPRLRGEDSPRLRAALDGLLALLGAPFPESTAKLRRMAERLDQEGFTDFYG